ncbi:MAG: dihydroorotate dehydrogenase electron transfer subunit [Nitrospirota bacterium]
MNAKRLHTGIILEHKPAGRGYFRLILKAPEAARTSLPGQFVMLRVSDTIDPLLARPFGIASIPTRSSIEILYRIAGKGTALLSHAKTGETLQFLGPLGNGFSLPEKGTTAVLVAGGSGFPPLQFFSQRVCVPIHLFVGSRFKECLPPSNILSAFRKNCATVHIATEDGSMGVKGMTTDILNAFLTKTEKKKHLVIYACGPHAMLAAISKIAAEHSLPCFVSLEARMGCGLGACMGCSVRIKTEGYKRVCKEGPVFDAREIDWSEEVRLPLPQLLHSQNARQP